MGVRELFFRKKPVVASAWVDGCGSRHVPQIGDYRELRLSLNEDNIEMSSGRGSIRFNVDQAVLIKAHLEEFINSKR